MRNSNRKSNSTSTLLRRPQKPLKTRISIALAITVSFTATIGFTNEPEQETSPASETTQSPAEPKTASSASPAASADTEFDPTEDISEDLSVPFPVDI